MCLKTTQLPRVAYTFYSQVNPTSLWCSPGNANWGYGSLAIMCCQKKISASLLIAIILICYKWHVWTVQLWDGLLGKNTQFPCLPTGLLQEEHPTVNLSASIKSCERSNVMLYNGAMPIEIVSFPLGKRLDMGLFRPSSSNHIKYVKYANCVYRRILVQCMVEWVKLFKQ